MTYEFRRVLDMLDNLRKPERKFKLLVSATTFDPRMVASVNAERRRLQLARKNLPIMDRINDINLW
jgi:hypothetical protein